MDPLSVTASAAGLISLGLTVSGGLIQYCQAYRSQDTDLAQLAQHAQELESFLNLVAGRTSGSQNPSTDIDSSLQKCQDACDACLLDFKRLNAKYICLSKPAIDLKERTRKLVRHLKYPFDKGKFDDLRSQLQEFNIKLLGLLQLINLDFTRELRSEAISEFTKITRAIDSIGTTLRSSISSTEQAVTTTIQDGVSRLESSFQRYVENSEKNITTSTTDGLGLISGQIAALRESQSYQALLLRSHFDQALGSQLKQMQNFHQTYAIEPVLDNRLGHVRDSTTNSHQEQTLGRYRSLILDSLCECPRTRRASSIQQHRKGCIYYSSNHSKWTFNIRFHVFNHQVAESWEIEYSQLAWWRGLQIHHNLTIRTTVDDTAPAVEVMRKLSKKIYRADAVAELEEAFRNCLIELRRVFDSGQGWPTDVSRFGRNLLHMACEIVFFRMQSTEQAIVATQFISALVQMGVPINDSIRETRSWYSYTPLERLLFFIPLYSPPMRILVNGLVNMGAIANSQPQLIVPVLQLQITELYEPLSCTELCHAVLHRNEHDVVHLLRSGYSVLTERSTGEMTMLHLAVNWPRGLVILIKHAGKGIESIINIKSDCYRTALEHAIKLEEADSVELLLNVGAWLTSHTRELLPRITNTARAARITHVIAKSLAQRRRDLLQLALLNLPTEKVTRFGLQREVLLDDKAFEVVQALKQEGVLLPAVYDDIEPGSVYHWRHFTSLIAQKLFDAGFHKTNTVYRGYHPLTVKHSIHLNLDLISWFEDRGADLYASIPIPEKHFETLDIDGRRPVYSTIHWCMANLNLYWSDLDNLPKKDLSLFRRFLEYKISDSCICYCTTIDLGCTSASKYTRNRLTFKKILTLEESSNRLDEFDWYLRCLRLIERTMSESDDYPGVALGITRACTFEILGMRHTCCKYYTNSTLMRYDKDLLILMDPEEIEDIRGEDRFLAALLETLMREFEKRFYELKLPLSQFMATYWWPRMQEVESEREELSAEDLHAIMEIGVVLDDA